MAVSRFLEEFPSLEYDGDCTVLVVDDDPACLEEYSELIGSLGYACLAALDPVVALQHISSNPQIAIVVSDIHMPTMDGISFFDEISSRFFQKRPMAAIAITGDPSLEIAISAMRSSAMDLLCKPVSRKDLAAALRRAAVKISIEADRQRLRALSSLAGPSEEGKAIRPPAHRDQSTSQEPSIEQLLVLARSIMKSRQARFDFLDEELFSDPSWDILLELTSAALEGRTIPSSSACAAAHAPMTTALRHISKLVESGMVRRWSDPTHKRRILLELTEDTFSAMKAYLVASWKRRNAVSGG